MLMSLIELGQDGQNRGRVAVSIKTKEKFYRTTVRSTLYGSECCPVKKSKEHRLQVTKMSICRNMNGDHTYT